MKKHKRDALEVGAFKNLILDISDAYLTGNIGGYAEGLKDLKTYIRIHFIPKRVESNDKL